MENSILELKYNMIINALFENASLSYNEKNLQLGNTEAAIILKALEPDRFNSLLGGLRDRRSKLQRKTPAISEEESECLI